MNSWHTQMTLRVLRALAWPCFCCVLKVCSASPVPDPTWPCSPGAMPSAVTPHWTGCKQASFLLPPTCSLAAVFSTLPAVTSSQLASFLKKFPHSACKLAMVSPNSLHRTYRLSYLIFLWQICYYYSQQSVSLKLASLTHSDSNKLCLL